MNTRAPEQDIWHSLEQYYKVAPRTAARAQGALERLIVERDQLRIEVASLRGALVAKEEAAL